MQAVVDPVLDLIKTNEDPINLQLNGNNKKLEDTTVNIKVDTNYALVKLKAQTSGKLTQGKSEISFDAYIVKDGQDTQITADDTEKVVLENLTNGSAFKIKVNVTAPATAATPGTYEGNIKLTVSGS